ncbi:hypothetical protein PV327_005330 [Microctonus hyperodae]|uniref:Uncharacterized protein n=1 Tax=Microctonus hyperodae TaxID=165561 RepID=A0AA39KZQ1_MICHY|nr:hypothetical protein PV327_005330 [Microctonus hyperodae]
MTTSALVTFEEFASGIVEACPPGTSMKSFFASITSEGPKEKHSNWIKVCDSIRQAKDLSSTSRGWRKNIHKVFMTNMESIEKIVWKKMIKQPVHPEDVNTVYGLLNTLLNDAQVKLENINAELDELRNFGKQLKM